MQEKNDGGYVVIAEMSAQLMALIFAGVTTRCAAIQKELLQDSGRRLRNQNLVGSGLDLKMMMDTGHSKSREFLLRLTNGRTNLSMDLCQVVWNLIIRAGIAPVSVLTIWSQLHIARTFFAEICRAS